MENLDCIFCKIVRKEVESPIHFEDDNFIIIPSKFPVAEKHFLILPKNHLQSIVHAQSADQEMLGKMMLLARSFAKEQSLPDYKLLFNAGKYTQVPHLHLHLLAGDLEGYT